jgi:hypothetical protein
MENISTEFLESIASNLGIATEKIYSIYTEGIRNYGKFRLYTGIVYAIGIALLAYVSVVLVSGADGSFIAFEIEEYMCWFIMTAVLSFIWFLLFNQMEDALSDYMFPEYAALRELITDFTN